MIIKSADPGRNNDSVEPIFVRLRAISSGEYYVRNAPSFRPFGAFISRLNQTFVQVAGDLAAGKPDFCQTVRQGIGEL